VRACVLQQTNRKKRTPLLVSWRSSVCVRVSRISSRTALTSMRLNSYTSVCSPLPWQTAHTRVLARLLLLSSPWPRASAATPAAATGRGCQHEAPDNSHASSSQKACVPVSSLALCSVEQFWREQGVVRFCVRASSCIMRQQAHDWAGGFKTRHGSQQLHTSPLLLELLQLCCVVRLLLLRVRHAAVGGRLERWRTL
jgi:hypothetical protein